MIFSCFDWTERLALGVRPGLVGWIIFFVALQFCRQFILHRESLCLWESWRVVIFRRKHISPEWYLVSVRFSVAFYFILQIAESWHEYSVCWESKIWLLNRFVVLLHIVQKFNWCYYVGQPVCLLPELNQSSFNRLASHRSFMHARSTKIWTMKHNIAI